MRLHIRVSAAAAQTLDEIASVSDGELDRTRAAECAMEMGLAALAERTAAEATQRITECLRCGAQMHAAQADGVSFRGCGNCGGIWLDNASATRLLNSLPAEAVELAQRAAEATTGTADTTAELDCPVCDRRMQHHHPDDATIRLDICATHGTWFDGGELTQILDVLLNKRRQRDELADAIRDAALDAELEQLDKIYEHGYQDGARRRHNSSGY